MQASSALSNGLAGPLITARWYDPAIGGVSNANGSPFPATESLGFTPQAAKNSDGFEGWVLVLEAQSLWFFRVSEVRRQSQSRGKWPMHYRSQK